MKFCPTHNRPLVPSTTKYGKRWSCTSPGCTVACWDGSTSTPADAETRAARIRFHAMFDPLWKNGDMFASPDGGGKQRRRNAAYAWLASVLGIRRADAHGGMFTREQCLRACEHIEAIQYEDATR